MKNSNFISLINIQNLPFFYGLLDEGEIDNSTLPRFMPFNWGVDLQNGLLRQLPNAVVSKAINQAYLSEATIAPPTGEGDFGEQWVSTIVSVLGDFLPCSIAGQKVLEIGCSNGLLLGKLASMGATCIGIEPGPQAETCRQRDAFGIHRCYFEQFETLEKFDLVYAINVLEHITDIDIFVAKLAQVLRPGGLFIAAVPDSALEMEAVSPNIFVHEHCWYFNPETLLSFLESHGFHEVRVRNSPFGSNFFVCGRFGGLTGTGEYQTEKKRNNEVLIAKGKIFAQKLTEFLERLQGRIDALSRLGDGCIGLYGASNAINFLGMLEWKIQPRIFDTDSHNHGKYLWSRQYPRIIVEDPTVDTLTTLNEIWILPVAHQVAIRDYLLQLGVPDENIYMYSALRNPS